MEAFSEHGARRKIAATVAALEHSSIAQIEDRLYNLRSAQECIAQGVSLDLELRIFEIGWSGESLAFVQQPLFLLEKPAALARKWAQIRATETP